MSKEFTEEQYREIVYMFSIAGDSEEETRLVAEYVSSIEHSSDYYKAFALANPVTREWAHEQFVEKENKYVWTSKKPCYKDLYKRLFMSSRGYVTDFVITADEKLKVSEDEYLTETEVRNYGYDPEWFDKEEVD